MTVARIDLDKCIGCMNCASMCPMDVMRFDSKEMKSVIAYPDNCQSCGQCYVNCEGSSIYIAANMYGYSISSAR